MTLTDRQEELEQKFIEIGARLERAHKQALRGDTKALRKTIGLIELHLEDVYLQTVKNSLDKHD